jgi:hypothetical protein
VPDHGLALAGAPDVPDVVVDRLGLTLFRPPRAEPHAGLSAIERAGEQPLSTGGETSARSSLVRAATNRWVASAAARRCSMPWLLVIAPRRGWGASWSPKSRRTPTTPCPPAAARSAPDRRDWNAAIGRTARSDRGGARPRFGLACGHRRCVSTHRFVEEAREALAAWGAHVQRLIDGGRSGAEIVPLRRA